MEIFRKSNFLYFFLILIMPAFSSAASSDVSDISEQSLSDEEIEQFANTNLEDFADLDIFSASKRPEKVREVAGSVYVITAKDIARTGVDSIPEALRMAPGVQVSRVSASSWAISIRGFNRQFSNKLLVLIDGRTVYTPLFSGVYWDVQDYPIEDIERIEVIRGPGGTLWGSNAVNGVINIITKEARKTQGNYASAKVGSHANTTEVRHGSKFDDINFYRVYGTFRNVSDFKRVGAEKSNDDSWSKGQAGFKSEIRDTANNKVAIQGDFYSGRRNSDLQTPTSTFPFVNNVDAGEDYSGANVMLKWNIPINDVQTTLQTYIDYVYRDSLPIIETEMITYDFDWQANYKYGRHDFVGGLGYRATNDNLENTPLFSYTPPSSSTSIINTFIQDKISLVAEKLYLILGSKFDYNDYTNFELQPNARVLWHINDKHSIWAAISRTVRTPSRGEDSFNRIAPAGLPLGFAYVEGNHSYESENLNAYEMGWRGSLRKNLYAEVNLFSNEYDDLRTSEVARVVGPTTFLTSRNNGYGETYGGEALAIWGVNNDWDLKFGYSMLKQNFHKPRGNTDTSLERDEQRSPSFQYSVTSDYDIMNNVSMNNSIYFVDDIAYYTVTGAKRFIKNYTRFDTTVIYKPKKNLELSITGQNLFDDNHQEFDEIIYSVPSEVPRMLYAQIKYKF